MRFSSLTLGCASMHCQASASTSISRAEKVTAMMDVTSFDNELNVKMEDGVPQGYVDV
jgi:hypothetical protein